MKMWVKVKTVFLIIVEILLLYSPEFKIFPKYTWLLAAVAILILAMKRTLVKKYRINSMYTFTIIGFLLLSVLWSLASILINNTSDFSYISFLLGTILTVFRSFILVYLIDSVRRETECTTDIYMRTLPIAGTVYVIFTISFIVFPNFKTIWLTQVVNSTERDYFAYQYRYSLNGFAAFASSTISSLLILLCAYLIVKNSKNNLWKKYFVIYIINIIGGFFYGRVCLFAIAMSIIYILISLFNTIRVLKILLTFIVVIGILVWLVDFLATINPDFLVWKKWAFAIVDQLFSDNKVVDYSVSHMFEDMYFMPSIKTILLGDGMYTTTSGGYYMHTDVGFMRAILFFGIFGCLINYCMILYTCKKVYRVSKSKTIHQFIWFVFFIFVILEMKGEAYQRILQITMPMYYFVCFDNNNRLSES